MLAHSHGTCASTDVKRLGKSDKEEQSYRIHLFWLLWLFSSKCPTTHSNAITHAFSQHVRAVVEIPRVICVEKTEGGRGMGPLLSFIHPRPSSSLSPFSSTSFQIFISTLASPPPAAAPSLIPLHPCHSHSPSNNQADKSYGVSSFVLCSHSSHAPCPGCGQMHPTRRIHKGTAGFHSISTFRQTIPASTILLNSLPTHMHTRHEQYREGGALPSNVEERDERG